MRELTPTEKLNDDYQRKLDDERAEKEAMMANSARQGNMNAAIGGGMANSYVPLGSALLGNADMEKIAEEKRRHLEAEKMLREALDIAERKFGMEAMIRMIILAVDVFVKVSAGLMFCEFARKLYQLGL